MTQFPARLSGPTQLPSPSQTPSGQIVPGGSLTLPQPLGWAHVARNVALIVLSALALL